MLPIWLMIPPSAPFTFDVESRYGLSVNIAGIPLIKGSAIQYFEPDYSKGYYSTSYTDQHVEKVDADTFKLTYLSESGATGTEVFHRNGNTLHVDETFEWNGEKPVWVENTAARFWAPALQEATIQVGDAAPVPFKGYTAKGGDPEKRRISANGQKIVFQAPWGRLTLQPQSSGLPQNSGLMMFDGRGYSEEWAEGKSLLWFGLLGGSAQKGQPLHVAFDATFEANPATTTEPLTLQGHAATTPNAQQPVDDRLPLIPYPKRHAFTDERVELGGPIKFPAGLFAHFDDFSTTLLGRFALKASPGRTFAEGDPKKPFLAFDGGINDMKLPHEAFQILVKPGQIEVFGQDEAGLRYGLRRLALLAYSEGGHVYLPVGTMTDWPSATWRGFHLFVGPNAVPFQAELAKKVLLPLGFSKAVLQCERAAWETLPNVRGGITMPLPKLQALFKLYRSLGIDPIPLVQSFGHMEWFFDGGANKELAVNPQLPYTIDPRKPESAVLLNHLWDEVIQVTGAKTVHFGCDEVDMRGMPHDPDLTTKLWQLQMPVLGDIAKKHAVSMMIWGDKCLAPGQAPDAALGDDLVQAQMRRNAIPPGSLIGDWHYANDPKFQDFFPSLDIWQQEGLKPIATTWYRPENVRAFTIAAIQRGAGILQSTWAGYESNAAGAVENFDQFAAFVLCGEYTWSGRQDEIKDLGYDYHDVFRRMFYEPPILTAPMKGVQWIQNPAPVLSFSIGRDRFAPIAPIQLVSAISATLVKAPVSVVVPFDATVSTVALACNTTYAVDRGAPVATVTLRLADGTQVKRTLKFGQDLLEAGNLGVVPLAANTNGRFAARLKLPKLAHVVSIEITADDAVAGFTVYGITGS